MYEFKSRVRYSEIDHRGTMTLPALINYFQDSSTFHSEAVGLGMEYLREKQKAWVLSYWQVIVERYPKLGEEITVGTFATEFKGLYGNRNFYMNDSSGSRLACANSIWVFMDLAKGAPRVRSRSRSNRTGHVLRSPCPMRGARSPCRRSVRACRRSRCEDITSIRMNMSTTVSMFRWRWSQCLRRRW